MNLSPVVYTDDQRLIVSAFERLSRLEQAGSYWEDEALKDLRSSIKTYYISAQGVRCCYCRRHLGTTNHKDWDIEHVVPRVSHPRFMFEPTNLAVACHDCNGAKREQRVLDRESRVRYPTRGDAFKIVHPHLDDYDEHIFRAGHVYLPRTKKGTRTIYVCNLLRFVEQFIDWGSSIADRRFEADITRLLGGGEESEASLVLLAAVLRDRTATGASSQAEPA